MARLVFILIFLTSAKMAYGQSDKARSKSTFGVAARYGGTLGIGFSPGAEVFFNVGSSLQLGITGFYHEADFKSDSQDRFDERDKEEGRSSRTTLVEKNTITGSLAMAHMRYFTGNSFYLSLAGGIRKYQFDTILSDLSETDLALEVEADVTSSVVQFGIGNMWQYDSGFVIGFDWVGIQTASEISHNSKSTASLEGQSTSLDEEEKFAEETTKNMASMSIPTLLILSMGWAI